MSHSKSGKADWPSRQSMSDSLPFPPFLILADDLIFVDSRRGRSIKYSMGYQISDRGFSWYSNQKQM
jgi:hypothetical protein